MDRIQEVPHEVRATLAVADTCSVCGAPRAAGHGLERPPATAWNGRRPSL